MEIKKSSLTKRSDLTGKTCPYTVLEVRKALEPLKQGHVLEVITDYQPAATESIPNFLSKKGYPFSVVKLADDKWRFIIKKME